MDDRGGGLSIVQISFIVDILGGVKHRLGQHIKQ